MQGDQLLEEWREAKETCHKIIDISINANIHRKQTAKQSVQEFMKVYDVVYRLCSNQQMEQTRVVMVYKDYKELLKTSLLIMAKNLHQQRDIYKLRMIRRIWDAYDDIMKRLKHMFAYLNRPFHLKEGKLDDLDRTGMVIICTSLFTEQSLLQYETIYFKQLLKIRQTQDYTDSPILKEYVEIIYKIHLRLIKKDNKKVRTLYTQFQQKFLSQTRDYYVSRYNSLKEFSPSQYFTQVHHFYESESKATEECFGIYSETFTNKLFSDQFLESYRKILITSPKGLKQILQHRETQTIKIITDIYKKLTDSIHGFKQPFEAFIYEEMSSLILEFRMQLLSKRSSTLHVSFIQKIITKNSQLIDILENSFMKFSQFLTYYKSGIEKAFSRNPLQTPIQQILVTYIMSKLKSYLGQDDRKEEIDHIISIFSCLENKDLFLFKYIQQTSRKILTLSDQGIQNHQTFIYRLKLHSGNKFTERLETIINENKQSLENQKQLQIIAQKQKLPIILNLRMFSEGVWPNQDIFDIPQQYFPQPLLKSLNCLQIYQKQIIKKKTLKLSYIDSKVRLIYYFSKEVQNKLQECYLDMNCLQAIILYYVYRRRPEKVSLKVLEQMFKGVKPQIFRYYLSLLVSMVEKVLLETNVEGEYFYEFNGLMKSKKKLINYDSGEGVEEQKLFRERLELNKDRQATVDGNIAKFMKSKKVITFDKLTQEIIRLIKVFTPSLKDIKNSVERLLAKDILIRDDKDRSIIKYKN